MVYSEQLKKAAHKYYHYTCKYSRAKGGTKILLYNKMQSYGKLTSELFKKEWEEYGKKSSCSSCGSDQYER
jgi:hypothetical protein